MELPPDQDPRITAVDELLGMNGNVDTLDLTVDMAMATEYERVLAQAYREYLTGPVNQDEELPGWVEYAVTSGIDLVDIHRRHLEPSTN